MPCWPRFFNLRKHLSATDKRERAHRPSILGQEKKKPGHFFWELCGRLSKISGDNVDHPVHHRLLLNNRRPFPCRHLKNKVVFGHDLKNWYYWCAIDPLLFSQCLNFIRKENNQPQIVMYFLLLWGASIIDFSCCSWSRSSGQRPHWQSNSTKSW